MNVIITGATSGIGKATAEKFAQNTDVKQLILTGRRAEKLSALKNKLQSKALKIHTFVFDVRSLESCRAHVQKIIQEIGHIDILINNAGLAKGLSEIHEGQIEHWETMLDTNVKGLLYMTRLLSPKMVERGSGHIINVASTAGKEVYPKGNVYCASKHAVDALTKGMRLDLFEKGIRVSQVAPGHVEETEFAKVRFDGNEEKAKIYEDFNPLTSQDVANAIHFIASQPPHVCIQDIVLTGSQQANSTHIDRSGRKFD